MPGAYSSAPTPVSALLSGLVIKIGTYAIARFVYTIYGGIALFEWFRKYILYLLLVAGLASALIGAFMMLVQSDVKRPVPYNLPIELSKILK